MRRIDAELLKHIVVKTGQESFTPEQVCGLIDRTPATEAVPERHSRWRFGEDSGSRPYCEDCHYRPQNTTNYCACCGAKMDKAVVYDG